MRWQSLTLIPGYVAPSSWWQHVPLAHWLVDVMQPNTIVELGTHYGVSFFSFCEAAEKFSPNSSIYAVDTWEGDAHAGGYGETVYKQVYSHWFKFHRRIGTLIRSTFDEACTYFPDSSIDLLHIDGLHTYEAVKHDFESWLPKMKKGAVVLFHDINVREREFGVWLLWDQLCNDDRYRGYTINNGYGLGILYLDCNEAEWLSEFQDLLPLLKSKGELLESLAELTPGGSFANARSLHSFQEAEEKAATASHAAETARLEAERANAEALAAKEELQKIIDTKSWKITKPLRFMFKILTNKPRHGTTSISQTG